MPEWDLGPEDAMQIDLLPNLPTSGGYQTVMTAIHVFSRYLFTYPLIEATATKVAKVIIDIMMKLLLRTKGPHLHQPSKLKQLKFWAKHSKAPLQSTRKQWASLRGRTPHSRLT